MMTKALYAIPLCTALIMTPVAALVWGREGGWAAGFGSLLGCGNLWISWRLGARAVASARTGDANATGRLGAALFFKMMTLCLLIWMGVQMGLPIAPLGLGLSVLVMSVLLLGVVHARQAEPA
jgi:hypothetical protein